MSEGRFLTGATMGHVVRMTATGAFGVTFVFLVDAANLVWISQLGDPRLVAAMGFAFAIQFFSVSCGVGLMIAATAMVSRSIGAGKRDLARRQAGAAMIAAAVFQAVVAVLIIVFRHPLLEMAGATGETATLAARYLLITMPSLVIMVVGLIASGVLRAEGLAAKAMYVTLLSGSLLMVIDPILILWMGLGLDGAAIGVFLFRIALMGLGLYFAVVQHRLVAWPTGSDFAQLIRPYLAIALPAIATQMATPVGNYLLTRVMAPFGDDAVAAWAVVGRLTVVAFGGIFALSAAIGGIFGQNYGAGQFDRIRATYRDALVFCLIYTCTTWVVLASTTSVVIRVFGLTGQGAEVLAAFTSIGVGGFIFVGALFVSNAAFNNLGKPTRPTILNWTKEAGLGWPAAAILVTVFGAPGVIYGQAAASAIVGTVACLWGWRFVQNLRADPEPTLDATPPRAYPNPDRFRRRS